jgi:transcription antitermination factor NusG
VAQTQLEAQGYRTFLPRFRKTIRHARKLSTVNAPFFPGYLFISLDLDRDRWRAVNSTLGVTGLIMGEGRPISVACGIVERLAESCGTDGLLQFEDQLVLGQPVRVLSGPFVDMVGKLVRLDVGARIQVLLQLLGGQVPVLVPRDAVISELSA